MYDLKIQSGDLVLANGGEPVYVLGGEKLEQEMSHILLTPLGADRFHPDYGSSLEDSIGLPLNDERGFQLSLDARSALFYLQNLHANLVNRIRTGDLRSTLVANELLYEVDDITYSSEGDTLFLKALYRPVGDDKLQLLSVSLTS